MKALKKHRHIVLVYTAIICCMLVFSTCINNGKENEPSKTKQADTTETLVKTVNYNQFAGSQVCGNCHKNINQSFTHTAHAITSVAATPATIKGSFAAGKNDFIYSPDRVVFLEKNKDTCFQVYYYKGQEHVRRRFDIVVGSGTKGQTYLSWVNHQLIELPVSYFTMVKSWANSPGYPLYPTLFNRPATSRCLECHSTYASTITPPFQEPEKYDSTHMILGITCEKCHGPAAKHVAYQQQHPEDTVGRFIVNTAKLSIQLNTDVCALCHSGRLQKTKPSFSFIAGDTLANYFVIDSVNSQAANIDVHGNQFGLLAASQCFKLSKTMTCITCHDVHKNERGNMQLFSQRCATCHTAPHKAMNGLTAQQINSNCIDCHMPRQPSMSIAFLLQGQTTPTHAEMRTHYITVYDAETKKFIKNLKAHH